METKFYKTNFYKRNLFSFITLASVSFSQGTCLKGVYKLLINSNQQMTFNNVEKNGNYSHSYAP